MNDKQTDWETDEDWIIRKVVFCGLNKPIDEEQIGLFCDRVHETWQDYGVDKARELAYEWLNGRGVR